MVCFRYIIVNNLHEGDNRDNNNNNNNLTRIWQLNTVYILPLLLLSTKGTILLPSNKTTRQFETVQSSP
jgi:hypothetical protein